MSALQEVQPPRVLFTGLKPNYIKELRFAFGDYVEVYNVTTNTSKEPSLPCIALYSVGNATSTWVMWCISTKAYERRLVWTKMVTNDMEIRTMNSYAEDANEKEEVVDEEPDDVPDLVDAIDVDSDDEDDDDDV